MDFAIIRLGTSPIPIGRTPGLLSIGINRHATNADKLSGWTDEVYRRRANNNNINININININKHLFNHDSLRTA